MKRLMSLETALFGEDKPRYHADTTREWRPAADTSDNLPKAKHTHAGRWFLTLSPATLAGLYCLYRRFSLKTGACHD